MQSALSRLDRWQVAMMMVAWVAATVLSWPGEAAAQGREVAVAFSATGFVADDPAVSAPTATVSGTFSFDLDDSGVSDAGIVTRRFAVTASSRIEMAGMSFGDGDSLVEVTWIDGALAQILFGSDMGGLGAGVDINPAPGTASFALVLLGGPAPEGFAFEQMRYTSVEFPTVTFETTAGSARVTALP